MMRPLLLLLAVCSSLVLAPLATAQVTGAIRGVVTDAGGDPIAAATAVIELQEDPPRRFETTTDALGRFQQIGLPTGDYVLTVGADGFASRRHELTIRIGETADVSFALAAAAGPAPDAIDDPVESAAATKAFEAGVAAAKDERHEEAIVHFAAALELLPSCHQCLYNIGVAHATLGRHDEAVGAFDRAIAIDPEYAAAYLGLATSYNALERYDEARAASERAASLSSATGAGAAASGDAAFREAIIAWNASRFDDARQKLEQVVAADPEHAEAHYWLGMAHLNGADLEAATPMFRRYLELAPDGQYAAEVRGLLDQLDPQ